MGMNRKHIAMLLLLAGLASVTAGVALIYLPAAPIVAGAGLAALGLLVVDVDGPRK